MLCRVRLVCRLQFAISRNVTRRFYATAPVTTSIPSPTSASTIIPTDVGTTVSAIAPAVPTVAPSITKITRLPKVIYADTNVLIGAVGNDYAVIDSGVLNDIIVCYNETVRDEYNAMKRHELPSNFKYVNSGLSMATRESAYRDLITRWNIPASLTVNQQRKFMNDMYIIFEASFSMFSKNSPWKVGQMAPILLTNNMRLYEKFLNTETKEKVIESIINAHGMEHLIQLVTLDRLKENGEIS